MNDICNENVCRSCMSESSETVSIFDCQDLLKSEYNHAYMVMAFASVQILSGDGLPEVICLECASQINKCYLFKLQCENSDRLLRKKLTEIDVSDNKLLTILEENQIKEEDDKCFNYNSGDDYKSTEDFASEDVDDKSSENNNYTSNSRKCKKKESRKTKNKFKCDICRKAFRYERCLLKHTRQHYTQNCAKNNTKKSHSKTKANKPTLYENDSEEKEERKYNCNKCKSSYADETQLTKHVNEKHICTICLKMVTSLSIHMRSHTGEIGFLCPTCGKGFTQLGNYNEHMLRHSGIKTFNCDDCEMSFVTKGALVAHSVKHSENKQYQCDICSSRFKRSDKLNVHKEIVHFGKKKYECDICHKKFCQMNVLMHHKLIHTGEKPHKCNFCEKKFTQKTTLTAHLRTHTGDRPYVCKTCGQAFGQRSTLRSHRNKENH